MEYLEKYYNEIYKNDFDVNFIYFSDEHKKILSKTLGFKLYVLGLKFRNLFKINQINK